MAMKFVTMGANFEHSETGARNRKVWRFCPWGEGLFSWQIFIINQQKATFVLRAERPSRQPFRSNRLSNGPLSGRTRSCQRLSHMEAFRQDTKRQGDNHCDRIMALPASGWDTPVWLCHPTNSLIRAFTRTTAAPKINYCTLIVLDVDRFIAEIQARHVTSRYAYPTSRLCVCGSSTR